MKNKILVFTILLMFLIPLSVFGAVSYNRTPTGYEIGNPVRFEVSLDNFADTGLDASSTYWGLWLNCDFTAEGVGFEVFTDCVPNTTLTNTFVLYVPMGYGTDDVLFQGSADPEICGTNDIEFDGNSLEGGFTIVGNIIGVSWRSVASTTAYIGDLINSVSPFLWLVIGLPLGFWIINETIKLATPKKVKIKK